MEEDKKEQKEEDEDKSKRPDLSKLVNDCNWECSVDGGTC